VVGTDLVRQRLKQRYWFFSGEWYLNTTEGVPYYADILVKNPVRALVESVLKAVAVNTPGVNALSAFDINYATATRQLSVDLKVRVGDEILEQEIEL